MVKRSGVGGSARLGIGSGSMATLAETRGASLSGPASSIGRRSASSLVRSSPLGSPAPLAPSSSAVAVSSGGPRRGRLESALAASADVATLESAVATLVEDQFAASTRAARKSLLATWVKLHDAAFRHDLPGVPAFPLSVLSLRRVGALFKAGRYQSFDNYLARAKAEHISLGSGLGGGWSVELERAYADTRRSVNRGAGSSRQSQPIDPLKVAALDLGEAPLVHRGPVAPGDFALVGIFFMLREIELTAALLGHVSFSPCASLANHSSGSASLLLPTSKTDLKALGATRTWDCVCRVRDLSAACPVHALLRQRARVQGIAEDLGLEASELPLFPDARGLQVAKGASVATIVALPKLYGCPVTDAVGACLFGGHSFRTGGAAFLAARGINPYKIQALGRWRSPLVIHYAGAALATGLALDLCGLGAVAPGSAPLVPPLAVADGFVESCISPVPNRPAPIVPAAPGVYVVNRDSNCVHWAPSPSEGCTRCGWGITPGRVRFDINFPEATPFEKICGSCLPELREQQLQSELLAMSDSE